MRRVACPRLLTVTLLSMPSRMNVVSRTVDAAMVTVFDAGGGVGRQREKPGAAVGSTDADVPM